MKFIAETNNTGDPSAHFQAEGKRIGELMQSGVLETVFLKANQSGAYLVLDTEDQAAARAAVESLPLAQKGLTSFELTGVIVPDLSSPVR